MKGYEVGLTGNGGIHRWLGWYGVRVVEYDKDDFLFRDVPSRIVAEFPFTEGDAKLLRDVPDGLMRTEAHRRADAHVAKLRELA